MFAVAANTTVRAVAQVKATKAAAKEQKSASLSSKAAGAAAALFLMASPAAFADGLTLNSTPGGAPAKYTQPFIPDIRRSVNVEKDSSADIGTEASRTAANKQIGLKGCKTITGQPCEGASQVTMQ